MNTQDIFKGKKDEISLRIKPSIQGESFKKFEDESINISYSQDAYWLISGEDRIEVEGVNPKDHSELDRIAYNNCINILVDFSKLKITLKAKLFTSIIPLPEGMEIGLTDIIIDDIDKRYSKNRNSKKHLDWLSEELILKEGNKHLILLDNAPAASGFRIFGKNIAIDVKKNKAEQFEIIRLVKWQKRFNPSFLVRGEIQIKDISKTGVLRQDTELKLNRIDSNERYIKTWESYQEKEKESKLKEVEERGFLKIIGIKQINENRYKLSFEENKNTENWLKIRIGSSIELSKNKEFPNFNTYANSTVFKLISKDKTLLTVDCEREFKDKDTSIFYACLSLQGDKASQNRRTKALKEIRNNSTPMPVLAAVLEGVDYNSVKRRNIKALTAKVKKEFGEFGPNEMQELALDVALNSPDITIIQGPPGTGKTKVITALAKRLTEIYKDNGQAPEMNILLTAFQHDAVENMASRTEVLGLPAIKFGKTQYQSLDVLEKWIKKQTEKIEAIQNEIEPNAAELVYKDVWSYYSDYIKTLNQEKALKNLKKICKENFSTIPDNILNDISKFSKKEGPINEEIKDKIISLINNIRTNKIAYEDDGAINLKRYLKKQKLYEDEMPKVDQKLIIELNNVLETENISSIDFKRLSDIQLELLEALKSLDIEEKIKKPQSKIENAFKKLIDLFSSEIVANGSIYSVLSDFHNDLNSNKERVSETVQNYVALAASTVQGSKSKALQLIKPDPFDTVIVDEAARANPLDLLIPLTSAKRRIVLVGDHRQLPHIIDNAIQKELEEDKEAAIDVTKFLKDSLFERFYNNLKKLHEKDGIQRVVTLNTQYRMHPIIGEFISKTFYEKYGDPVINSGTPKEKLRHSISEYQNKVAVSINIPNIKEAEKKENGSTFRPIEAKEAIRRAKDILDSDPSISVGVITFYSRQVTELLKEAEKNGLTEKNETGEYSIAKNYQKTTKDDERFRIGSVDAFQGKEFDVVILSLVRSNKIKIKNGKDIRRKYGFLSSYQRLNVAMSRAKKLIIATGDEEMFKNEDAKENIFGLYAFYNELINSEHGISI